VSADRRTAIRFLLALALLAGAWALPRFLSSTATSPAAREAPSGRAPEADLGTDGAGFRTSTLLAEHFRKHGREFGAADESEYLRLARSLRDRPAEDGVLEARREDGVVTRFDLATGAFLAFDPNGTIRTFFKPNQGEAYFRRQAARGRP